MAEAQKIWPLVQAIREKGPLVHNITNYVIMNTSANTLLAIGASPVMAHAVEEVEAMDVDYLGVRTFMKPSVFLELAERRNFFGRSASSIANELRK